MSQQTKPKSFSRFLFTGERGRFLKIAILALVIVSIGWIHDSRDLGYSFEIEGVAYLCFLAAVILIILGTVAQAYYSDYPKEKNGGARNG